MPARGTHEELGPWPLLLHYGREALENDIAWQDEAIANSTDLPHLSRATEPFPLTTSCAGPRLDLRGLAVQGGGGRALPHTIIMCPVKRWVCWAASVP